jgi:hypothetical protein
MKVNSKNLTVIVLFILLTVLSAVGIIVAINLQGTQAPDDSLAGDVCSGPGNASACTEVGQNVAISGGSCTCTRTSGTLCACVPTAGVACTAAGTECTSMGASCTKNGVTGTCISGGTINGDIKCLCSVNGSPTTGTPTTCTSDAQCGSGKYCNSGNCANKVGNGIACGSNRQCLSDNCVSGLCRAAGGSQCTTDSQCAGGEFCGDGVCKTDRANGSVCGRNAQCSSNVCISNVCRAAGSGSCINGQVTCEAGGTGFGTMCSNGSLDPATRAKYDACAPNVSGQQCTNLTTYSGGEPNKGRFVGCNGALNCFCPHNNASAPGTLFSSSSQNVTTVCVNDSGNDSCGANANITTTPTTGGGDTGTPPTTGEEQLFCGDAICATNELCERTSPGSSTFKACRAGDIGSTPGGAVVTECYRITDGTNQVAGTGPRCKFCGDGLFHDAEEVCDPTAPATGGNQPDTCSITCTPEIRECLGVNRSSSTLAPGVGNTTIFTLRFRDDRSAYPYDPGVQMRVSSASTTASAVGRDANNAASTLVGLMPGAAGKIQIPQTDGSFIYEYKFEWEAATTGGQPVGAGTYTVEFLNNGSPLYGGNEGCKSSITISQEQVENPLFSIVKLSTPVCESDNDSRIDYTVRVTNTGPVEGVIDSVIDTLDAEVIAAGITPTSINPSYGTYAAGKITWIGTVADRTYTSGQTKEFTYSLTIPSAQVASFTATGIDNQVVVTYDTEDTDDNTDSFTLNTPVACSVTVIPETGILDDGRFLILGALFVLTGIYVYRRQYIIEHSFETEIEKKLSRKADEQD